MGFLKSGEWVVEEERADQLSCLLLAKIHLQDKAFKLCAFSDIFLSFIDIEKGNVT